jgi:hypothetical protein
MPQELLLYTQDLQKAKQEIVTLGGRITQQFTDTVIVVNLPDSIDPQTLKQSTAVLPDSLDPVSQLAVNAWNQLQVKRRAEGAPSATEGLSWDTPGYSPPRKIEIDPNAINRSITSAENIPEESTGTPTSRYMVGSIAVGVVIVSGTQGGLGFSPAEQQQVIQEVQEGLNFLAGAEPRANITFVYDIRLVTISATPGSTDTYENAEAPWRDAALQQMGFPANRSGSVQYVQNLRSSRGTDWAYVGYFTKYPLHHFAYAIDEKVCMNYSNDGWGSDQINRVFAHESCHIFGAADEYGNCSCGGSHGHLGVPNNNCVKCSGTHVACLMDANVQEICQWSRGQIGWDDRLLGPSWHRFELASSGRASGGGNPIAVSRIPDSMEVWWIGADGSIQDAYWYDNAGWQGFELAPPGSASPNGGITAVSRIPNSMEVWWVGANGSVQGAFWYEGSQWQRYELAPAGSASTTGGITAVSRIPNSMEIWWVGADGSIQDAFWYEGGQWQRFELAPAGSTSPNGAITAVSRIPNSMEVWWIGGNGSVQDAFWYEGGEWQRFELAPAGSASDNGGITTVSRIPNSMEVFWIGANGSVQDAFWYEGGQWQRFELAPAGSASGNGDIMAVSRIPNSMEVWWVGANGSVQDAFWYEGGQWQRFELAPPGSASTSGGITAVSRIPSSMEVWWVGANGSVQDGYWYG